MPDRRGCSTDIVSRAEGDHIATARAQLHRGNRAGGGDATLLRLTRRSIVRSAFSLSCGAVSADLDHLGQLGASPAGRSRTRFIAYVRAWQMRRLRLTNSLTARTPSPRGTGIIDAHPVQILISVNDAVHHHFLGELRADAPAQERIRAHAGEQVEHHLRRSGPFLGDDRLARSAASEIRREGVAWTSATVWKSSFR